MDFTPIVRHSPDTVGLSHGHVGKAESLPPADRRGTKRLGSQAWVPLLPWATGQDTPGRGYVQAGQDKERVASRGGPFPSPGFGSSFAHFEKFGDVGHGFKGAAARGGGGVRDGGSCAARFTQGSVSTFLRGESQGPGAATAIPRGPPAPRRQTARNSPPSTAPGSLRAPLYGAPRTARPGLPCILSANRSSPWIAPGSRLLGKPPPHRPGSPRTPRIRGGPARCGDASVRPRGGGSLDPAYLPGAPRRQDRRAAEAAAATAAAAAAAAPASWPGALSAGGSAAPDAARPRAGSAEPLTSPRRRPWRGQGRARLFPSGGGCAASRRESRSAVAAQAGPSRRPAPPRQARLAGTFPGAPWEPRPGARASLSRSAQRGPGLASAEAKRDPTEADPRERGQGWAWRRGGAERGPRQIHASGVRPPLRQDPATPEVRVGRASSLESPIPTRTSRAAPCYWGRTIR